MGKTHKDRDRKGLPRVPRWAMAKPTRIERDKRKAQVDDLDDVWYREPEEDQNEENQNSRDE